jgi:hypothetical protein
MMCACGRVSRRVCVFIVDKRPNAVVTAIVRSLLHSRQGAALHCTLHACGRLCKQKVGWPLRLLWTQWPCQLAQFSSCCYEQTGPAHKPIAHRRRRQGSHIAQAKSRPHTLTPASQLTGLAWRIAWLGEWKPRRGNALV